MRVLIAGGRDFCNYDMLCQMVDAALVGRTDVTIVSGRARGADQLGERYARERGYAVDYFPAQWDKHGKAAGMIRNKQMIDSLSSDDLVLCFWDGLSRGTKNTIDTARKRGIKTGVARY